MCRHCISKAGNLQFVSIKDKRWGERGLISEYKQATSYIVVACYMFHTYRVNAQYIFGWYSPTTHVKPKTVVDIKL